MAFRRRVESSSARERSPASRKTGHAIDEWRSRASSSLSNDNWSTSADSELATVGSHDFETESSTEEKRSFAVFSSTSNDSRHHSNSPSHDFKEETAPINQETLPSSHPQETSNSLAPIRQYDRIREDPSTDGQY